MVKEGIFLIIFAYLIGSIPFGLILGILIKKVDIRNYGSGNIGSTNAFRVLGPKLGILTFILDFLKGAIPILIAKYLNLDVKYLVLIGLFAILGHSYSIYLRLKGGKAVAVSFGIFSVLIPKTVLILILVFFAIFYVTKYVSLASIVTAISLPIFTFLLYNNIEYIILSVIVAIIVVIRHRSNIINLINGEEDKLNSKVKKTGEKK